jgi:acyl CoA:acetate/3-ketoacid CoA transferase
MASLSQVLGTLYIGIAFLVWCGIVYYMFRVVALRKPGVSIWLDTFFNPFNLILMSSKLTEAGIKARRTLIILFVVFICMVLFPALLERTE